jgi:hypothetical protein
MKPRRENGATFVSPMTSDVSRRSAPACEDELIGSGRSLGDFG